jgi:D-tyrosyl-tRNA(Tyr) deacylase
VCERTDARRGVFGADMEVEMTGDGPVTILVDV